DALAAPPAQEDGEHVPDDRRAAGDRDDPGRHSQAPSQPDRHGHLARVGGEDRDRPALAQRARDGGRADVAAADLAQIDALGAREQQPERDRARKVRGRAEHDGVHDEGGAAARSAWGAERFQNAATSSSNSVRGQSGGRLAISVAPYVLRATRPSSTATMPRSVRVRIRRPNPCLSASAARGSWKSPNGSPPSSRMRSMRAAVSGSSGTANGIRSMTTSDNASPRTSTPSQKPCGGRR